MRFKRFIKIYTATASILATFSLGYSFYSFNSWLDHKEFLTPVDALIYYSYLLMWIGIALMTLTFGGVYLLACGDRRCADEQG